MLSDIANIIIKLKRQGTEVIVSSYITRGSTVSQKGKRGKQFFNGSMYF